MASERVGDMTKEEFEEFLFVLLDKYFDEHRSLSDLPVESMADFMRRRVEARKGSKLSNPISALDLLFEGRELHSMSFLKEDTSEQAEK